MFKTMQSLAFGYFASLLKEANAISEGLAMNQQISLASNDVQPANRQVIGSGGYAATSGMLRLREDLLILNLVGEWLNAKCNHSFDNDAPELNLLQELLDLPRVRLILEAAVRLKDDAIDESGLLVICGLPNRQPIVSSKWSLKVASNQSS